MDDGLKQRLVGAIVLIAIAVLFVPVLFERSSERELDLSSQIPAEPVVVPEALDIPSPRPQADFPQPKPLDAPPEAQPESAPAEGLSQSEAERVPDNEPEAVVESTSEPVPPATNVAPEPRAETAASPAQNSPSQPSQSELVPAAWSIQVGSFSEQSRAMALAERLLKDDFRAYVREVESGGKAYHRVYVGPKLNRADAEAEKARLDKALGANTLIVQFES